MDMQEILVCYKSDTILLKIPADASLDDLKSELCIRTGLHPSLQNIKLFPNDDQEDEPDLKSILFHERIVWLSSSDTTDESNYANDSIDLGSSNASSANSKVATVTFQNNYIKSFSNYSLKEALMESCQAAPELRKPLVLYLHYEDQFSKTFCSLLTNGKVRDILDRRCIFISWDLLSVSSCALENVVDKWEQLQYIKNVVTNKHGALFIIYPFEESFFIYSYMHGSQTKVEDIEATLEQIQNSFLENIQAFSSDESRDVNSPDQVLGSSEYQQTMFDRLDDRDYGSFEENPHKYLGDSNTQLVVSKPAASNFTSGHSQQYVNYCVRPEQNSSLSDALRKSCRAAPELCKPLALYLHYEEDKFSKTFCSLLTNGKVRDILDRSFIFIFWDLLSISDDVLEDVVDKWEQLEYIQNVITNKHGALFIICPCEESFFIYSYMHGSRTKVEDIETALEQIQNSFLENTRALPSDESLGVNSPDRVIRSAEFQQTMFDRLGDRDYDSFEADQHEYLKEKIGFAKFGFPEITGYTEKQNQKIMTTYSLIKKHSSRFSKWKDRIVMSFIYNCLDPLDNSSDTSDTVPVPVFVIRKCTNSSNPCRIFIDHDDRVYSSWKSYKTDNKLHKCMMIMPRDGRYQENEHGEVKLERCMSPACGINRKVLLGTDIASSVVGVSSSAVLVAAAIPAITIAPIALISAAIVGMGVGVYGIGRSIAKVVDRVTHDETMNITNSEARSAYINIAAGSLGIVGAGTTTAVTSLVTRGVAIGEGAKVAVNVLNVANVGTSAVSIANSSYEIIDNWKESGRVSSLSILQLSTSILFFSNAIYNFRTANTIIEEAQLTALKKYEQSLGSNKLKKMFNKMFKETTRVTGNIEASRTEVISTLSKVSSFKETFAILSRYNKEFNEAGIRFAAQNGKITLNGIAVDINEIGAMSVSERAHYFSNFPSIPKTASVQDIKAVSTMFNSFLRKDNLVLLVKYGNICMNAQSFKEVAAALLQDFSENIKASIVQILEAVLKKLRVFDIDISQVCKCIPYYDPILVILKIVVEYFKGKIIEEVTFQSKYPHLASSSNAKKRFILISEKVVDFFICGGRINQFALQTLTNYVINLITSNLLKTMEIKETQSKRIKSTNRERCCSVCGGTVYSD